MSDTLPAGSTPVPMPKAPPKSARRRAREFAVQGLYEWLLNPAAGIDGLHVRLAEGFHKCDTAHFEAILRGVVRDIAPLTEGLQPFLDRPVAELSPVERAALLLGSFELHNCLDIPYRVVINEAVEITKTFGGTDGYKYINGVLDKLAGQVRSTEAQAASR